MLFCRGIGKGPASQFLYKEICSTGGNRRTTQCVQNRIWKLALLLYPFGKQNRTNETLYSEMNNLWSNALDLFCWSGVLQHTTANPCTELEESVNNYYVTLRRNVGCITKNIFYRIYKKQHCNIKLTKTYASNCKRTEFQLPRFRGMWVFTMLKQTDVGRRLVNTGFP